MDPPVKARLKEDGGAPALPPAMSSLLEEIAQVFKSLQSLHQQEADNRVTVALLALSSHRPPPRPYLHASSSYSIKENNAEENPKVDEKAFNTSKRKRPKSFPFAVAQTKNQNMDLPRSIADPDSNYESEEVGSEVLEEIKLFSPSVQFKDVRNFEDFKIVVDGMIIDKELSEDHRHKYYKLCCSQNAYLHENLISGINCKLISGSISETVNIADAIRASKLTTSREEFIDWDKTLSGLEMLGMSSGFIRTRLHQLVSLVLESESSKDTRRYVEAKTEQAHTHNEMRNIEARLVALKEAFTRCSVDIKSPKWKAERYELKLQQVAFAPW